MIRELPELVELQQLIERVANHGRVRVHGEVTVKSYKLPLYSISFGSSKPEDPSVGFFGGVHGLERIGSRVLIAYLATMAELLHWDEATHALLEKSRLVFMPLVNPGGMFLQYRANPNGVDLMRNAPVDAEESTTFPLAGGHRISPRLPWYRGKENAPLELEAQAVCEVVRTELFPSKVSLSLDVHSGYGTKDRLWFPYARTKKPFPHLPESMALKLLLDRTFPNHVYVYEPQSMQYTTHGDLWDYLYDEHAKKYPDARYLPLTLEMGSWNWVKKNPLQIFSAVGAFNPIKPHRRQRTLRRHILFLEFVHRAVLSSKRWAFLNEKDRAALMQKAVDLWFKK